MLICIFSVVSGGLDLFQVVSPVDLFVRCCSADTFFLISSSQRAGAVHISDTADQVKEKAKTSWKVSESNWKRQRADAGRSSLFISLAKQRIQTDVADKHRLGCKKKKEKERKKKKVSECVENETR